MTTITYDTKSLKMTENNDGIKTTKTFKSLDLLLDDKREIDEYNSEFPSESCTVILR